MDELLEWKHIAGPGPDLSAVVKTDYVLLFCDFFHISYIGNESRYCVG